MLENRKMVEMPHVLIIDDDQRIRQLVSRYLQKNGFVVCSAPDATSAREIMKQMVFDVLIVDIMMPGESGLEFTSSLGKDSDIPVLLLTALGSVDDRITGLEAGADDYLPKPFEPRELVLRLKAILKRSSKPVNVAGRFHVGRWRFDAEYCELKDGDDVQRLTDVEATLLRALAGRAGEVVSRDELAQLCGMEAGERTIDVQVTRLRRKIEEDTKKPRYLQTVRGKGYLLRVED